MDSDGFTIVRSSGRRVKTSPRTTILAETRDRDEIDVTESIRKIHAASTDLKASIFFDKLCVTLQETRKCEAIWCFGLGHIGECVTARYQLALLLLLKDVLDVPSAKVFVNDPIFFSEEVEILQKLELNVALENIECKLACRQPAFLFLPHCPRQLSNNLLFSNWSGNLLANITVLANSFNSIVARSSRKELEQSAPLVQKVVEAGLVQERVVENTFRFEDIFNDSSVHVFSGMEGMGESFWEVEEQEYLEGDTEFIRRKK